MGSRFLFWVKGECCMEIFGRPHLGQEEGGASPEPLFSSFFFLVGPNWKSQCANDVRCVDQEKVDIDMDDMEGRIREVAGP